MTMTGGAIPDAARSSNVFDEPDRKLPDIATIRMCMVVL